MATLPIAVLDFPLEGEWVATNTPAHAIPSHGTDYLAQTYAIDLVKVDQSDRLFERLSMWKYLLSKVPATDSLTWRQPIFAPGQGVVVDVQDQWPDRPGLNLLIDQLTARLAPPRASPNDLRPLAGNHVILQTAHVFVMLAHLRCGSMKLSRGQSVRAGDRLGEIGNSGNSTMPHLHIQAMDGANPRTAKGLPYCFRDLEYLDGEIWRPLDSGVPGRFQRVRRISALA